MGKEAGGPAEMCKHCRSRPGDEGRGTGVIASAAGYVFRFHVPCPHGGTYQGLVFDRGEYELK